MPYWGRKLNSAPGGVGVLFGVPDAPTNLVKDAASSSSTIINITWDEPYYNNGSAVTGYRIIY